MLTALRRRLIPGVLALLACSAWTGAAAAQENDPRPPTVRFDADETRLLLGFGDLLLDGGLRRALEQGLPLRIRVTAELWRDGFFDRQEGEAEWGASVVLDPVAREYEVAVAGQGVVGRWVTLSEVTDVLEEAFQVRLRPRRDARYYYLAELEVETLSLSDLGELRRWLGGDVASAVRGEDEVENAVASGVRRIFVRALGLPARRERLRTPTFEWEPGSGVVTPGG
ncbi:MAG TPA: hypothetical protein VJ925_13510 [Longimicrobiales bacterium]|nr:hypothetical protein [Longimicrobiales bacterium]